MSDEIVSAFLRNVLLDARRISVENSGTWIVLRGSVYEAKRAEAQWVNWVALGVSEGENNIIISPYANKKRNPERDLLTIIN